MTIRRQFHILLAAIIVIPICCALFIPSYHYFTSPGRALIHDYKELRKSDAFKLSMREWSKLHDYIRRLPPDMEVAVFSLSGSADILISSIAELKAGTSLSPLALWGFASSTSDTYFYQFTSFRFAGRSDTIIILSRVNKFTKREKRGMDYVNYLVGILLCFAVLVLIIIAKISRDIFTSITILEQRTQKIADGDLSVPIADDVKQSKAKSNEIISLTENLEKMRNALLDAHERRTRFIMGISHDLRAPVAVIKGYTEAISDGVITDKNEIKKSLEIIATKTNQLESMIDTLINFVKLDSADWRQKLAPESVFAVVSEFAKRAAGKIDGRFSVFRHRRSDLQCKRIRRIALKRTVRIGNGNRLFRLNGKASHRNTNGSSFFRRDDAPVGNEQCASAARRRYFRIGAFKKKTVFAVLVSFAVYRYGYFGEFGMRDPCFSVSIHDECGTMMQRRQNHCSFLHGHTVGGSEKIVRTERTQRVH